MLACPEGHAGIDHDSACVVRVLNEPGRRYSQQTHFMSMDSFAPPAQPVVGSRSGDLERRSVVSGDERRADYPLIRISGEIPDERRPVLYDTGGAGIDESRDEGRPASRITCRPRSDADLQPAISRSS